MVWVPLYIQAQMLPVKSGRLWGLIDPHGEEIAPPKFDAIPKLMNRQAVVVQDGKYGLIDSTGRLLVAPDYTFIDCYTEDIILTNQGGNCQSQDCEGGKWGILHLRLNAMVPPTYQFIGKFDENGRALVNLGGRCGYDDCDGGVWGIIDTAAQEIVPPMFRKIESWPGNELYVQGDSGWGMYNIASRSLVIPTIYEQLSRISSSHIALRVGQRWGVLNNRGEMIVPPRHEGFKDAGRGYLAYQRGLLLGLMDSTGRILSEPLHSYLWVNDHDWVTYKDDLPALGLADTSNRAITRDHLSNVCLFARDFCIVTVSPFQGVVDRAGSERIPIEYDQCHLVNDSTILARRGTLLKWYTLAGEAIRSIRFDSLDAFSARKVARGKTQGRWGLINMEGQWIMPPRYEEIRVYFHAAKGRQSDDWTFSYFDDNGHASKVKRIVIIKEEENIKSEDLLSIGSSSRMGWFMSGASRLWGLRDTRSNRVLIEPKYPEIEVIPRSEITLVKSKIKGTEDQAWGMVNHTTGKEVVDPFFEKVFSSDWLNHPYARVIYAGSGKYALLSLKGEVASFENATFIGPFCDSIARINLGGRLEWSTVVGMDTLVSDRSRDKFSNEIKLNYQYCRGGKWGYIDQAGKWLKPAEYECALDFDSGMARIKTSGKWGAVDKRFQVVVKPQFDFIERLFTVRDRTLFAVGEDKMAYGFIDEKGEISISPRFQEVGQFSEGLVKFREGYKWGYANLAGEVVIPAQYAAVGDFHQGRARVRDNRAWGYIDTLGNPIIPQKYLRAGDFHEGLAWVQTEKFFGFLDLDGHMEITPLYSAVGDFSEGLAPAKRKGVYGLINRKGSWVVAPHYYRIGGFKDSVAVIQEKGRYGLITPQGEFLVKPNYREIADFSEGLVRFKSGMQYGFMDPTGSVKIAHQYSNAADFSCGRAAVFIQGKWGYIDSTGQVVIQPIYPKVNPFAENRAAVRLGDKWGFVDLNGDVVVPIVYDKVSAFQDGRAAVFVSGQGWGFVNPSGTLVIPCLYDGVGFRQAGIISVQKESKWGLINTYGAVMTPCKYDAIGNFSQDMAAAMMRRSVGVVDGQGRILLEPHYDTVRRVADLIQVEDDDAVGYIDLDGNWIWQLSK